MRIRTKLLSVLLALVLPPLVAVSFYALRQARLLGHELAWRAADIMKGSAERELALMVDLIGEDLNDNRQMQELALALLARSAGKLLAGPPEPAGPVLFDTDFDAGGGLPHGVAPLSGPGAPPVPATAEAPAMSLPPGQPRTAAVLEDAGRLSRMLPAFELLRQKLRENMLWAYFARPGGLLCTFPGHGRMPDGYDARTRPWYRAALDRDGPVWTMLIDASTGKLTFTISMAVRAEDGGLLGVAGIDVPIEAMLPESDLSKRWGDGVLACVVLLREGAGGAETVVVGSRDFLDAGHGWDAPVSPTPLRSPDAAALARLAGAIDAKRPEQLRLRLEDTDYFAVFKPFPDTPAGLLVLVPRQSVLAQADTTETAILERTRGMMAVVVAFALAAVLAAVVLASLGARAVVRPVTALCGAAGRLARGDLTARAPVTGRDELATLAETFNDMAPKLAERLRLKQDMLLAMEVQQNLLPKAPPALPGLDIAGSTSFCDETGGDYFDFPRVAPHGERGCDVALGDATGHGIAAALFMATGRALLRGGGGCQAGPGALLSLVNGLLCQDTADSGRFITLFFLRLENGGLAPEGRLAWARAGHDPALLYDPGTDAFEELMGPGLPLGVLPDYAYAEQSRPGLWPGQILAVGTDGIWEARAPSGAMYGKDRFKAVLRRHAGETAGAIVAAVHADVAAFQAGSPRDDDITLVVVKALPAA